MWAPRLTPNKILPAPPEGAESSMPALRCERLQGLDIPSRSRLDLTNLALPEFIRG